jgi:hypothetical protein
MSNLVPPQLLKVVPGCLLLWVIASLGVACLLCDLEQPAIEAPRAGQLAMVQARGPTSPTGGVKPRRVADTANAPTAMVRPSPSASSLVHGDIVEATKTHRVSFEFRVGIELDLSFTALAKRLIGAGSLHAQELRTLRQHALDRHGTIDDYERMFMAALMTPANAAVLTATPVRPDASVTFELRTIAPNMSAIINFDRESLPVSVSRPLAAAATDFAAFNAGGFFAHRLAAGKAAEHEIRVHAGRFGWQVSALLELAAHAHVALPNVLAAMLAGASDSSAGDQLMAGTVYVIAAEASNPLADELLAGHFKVAGMLRAQLGALIAKPNVVPEALYFSSANHGVKGDTLYIPVELDITDIEQRSGVVHELQHVRDDQAGPSGSVSAARPPQMAELEANAFRVQGQFVLEQMVAQAPADRATTAKRMAAQISELEGIGMILAAVSDRVRFESAIVAIASASPPEVSDVITELLKRSPAALEAHLQRVITSTYDLPPGQLATLNGFSGESILIFTPPSRK